MAVLAFNDIKPNIGKDVWIAKNATVIGDVVIGEGSSVWFGAVIRGDVNYIRIGKKTNIQDNSVLHVTTKKYPLHIGDNVTIGHRAMLHGCTIKDNCLIGMGAIILDGAIIEENAIVGAGALVKEGQVVKANSLVVGVPARFVKNINAQKEILVSAEHYYELAMQYKSQHYNRER